MAQEDISRPKKIENPQYFGWESFSQFNLNERRAYAEKDFSISTKHILQLATILNSL